MPGDPAIHALAVSLLLGYVYAFMGGFTDAANAIATAVGTRAFSPLQAVLVAGVFELLGALTGTAVALTIGHGIVAQRFLSQATVCAALLAAMCWSYVTFLRGIPVSETHGLIGGIVGAGLSAGGVSAVEWRSLLPALLAIIVSPLLGFFAAAALLVLIYRVLHRVDRVRAAPWFFNLQRLSSTYMAFSHGRNDAQKPMGVLAMALAAYHGHELVGVPLWVIVTVAATAALGVAAGGWRIIRTLGLRLTGLNPVQGFAAEAAAATVLQAASSFGVPVSTTHAITAAIVGAGTVHGRRHVRWHVVGEIMLSWLVTLPATVALGYVFARLLLALPGF
jgi:inorganic phosphate transporter, PiT family